MHDPRNPSDALDSPAETTLAKLAARLTQLEDDHAREVAALRDQVRALEARPRVADTRGTPTMPSTATRKAAHARKTTKASRRGLLGTAAKVAAATVVAGVLVEQVGTRAAYADNLGNFSSSNGITAAVIAIGKNGSDGLVANTDSGYGINAASNSGPAVSGNSISGTGVVGSSGGGDGVFGYTFAASEVGVRGSNSSNTSGSVAVLGHSDDGSYNLGPGIGVQGEAASGTGVYGTATTGTGVHGRSTGGLGVVGDSTSNDGVEGTTLGANGVGVRGVNLSNNGGGVGVLGHSDDGVGGLGPGTGVHGETASGTGVQGTATTGTGVVGVAPNGTGIFGNSTNGTGIYGVSTNATGILGTTTASGTNIAAVRGMNSSNTAAGIGVLGQATDGMGNPAAGTGVQGTTGSGTGVSGTAMTGVGVYGASAGGASKQAIWGAGTSGTGINVQSATGSAVIATSNGVGYGLYLTAPSGWAIGCAGRIRVLGNAFGTATLAKNTTTKSVSTGACDVGSLVLLTPTSDPGARIWAVAGGGAFTIHASSAPASDIVFTYLLIN